MNWNNHSTLNGVHAFMSASQCAWLNDDPDKLKKRYLKSMAAQRGTELHALAAEMIRLGVEAYDSNATFNKYVNDAIGFRMRAEQPLYYSPNVFGTADAISFEHNFLRIHDLKTGEGHVRPEQLYIYAALFCLEYHKKPGNIKIELRIYQNDDIKIFNPTADEILPIMDKIIQNDKIISQLKGEIIT